MIRIYKDSKIYVYCPAGVVSGGAELLHQLVSTLRDHAKNAYMVYYGNTKHQIPTDYKDYNIELTKNVELNPHNIEVLFEPLFYKAADNTPTQKILWWLSVDNFFRCSNGYLSIRDIAKWSIKQAFDVFLRRCYKLFFRRENIFKRILSLSDIAKLDVVSAYQSEYAQNFLLNNGFREMFPLKDFINTDHFNNFTSDNREDIVLYNPKKGLKYTKSLMRLAPDIKWIPIENMSRMQVVDAMRHAKVYVDFGFHPGKDRLPRECAMNGLCVITGYRGSARYYEDVWIENKYKFFESTTKKKDIIRRIRETLLHYETSINDFAFYRYMISLEKTEFEDEVKHFFLNGLYE